MKALAPPSLQEAVRPHNLKASYKAARIRVEQADEQSLYVCTVETGCRSKGVIQPDVQVGSTSDHTVAIITQVQFSDLLEVASLGTCASQSRRHAGGFAGKTKN